MMIALCRKMCAVSFGVAALPLAAPAASQSLTDKYWFQAGAYFADVDSSIRVNGDRGIVGTEVDFESDLELDERRVLPSFSGGVRLGGGWQITGDLYTLKRRGTRTIGRDIIVDDVVYPVGAELTSGFRSTTFRIAGSYSFVRGKDHEIGATLGLHLTDFSAFVEGAGRIGEADASVQRRQEDLLAPLPAIGIYGRVAPARDLTLAARVDYLKLKISDYTGALVNAEGSVTWRVHRNIGIGALYRHVDYSLDVDKTRWNGGIGYRFSGPMLFAEIGF